MSLRKSTNRKTLAQWIKEAINDPDKDGPLTMMALVHMVGQQQKELHTTKFAPGKDWKETDLADMFRGKAETYCQDLPGLQTFQLLAFYGGRSEPEAFLPFVINVNADVGNGLATEAPTEQGKTQQSMRHTEMLLQQVYRRQQVMDDFTMSMIERLGGMVEKLTHENQEAFSVMKELLMEQATKTHEHKMAQLKFERDTAERKKWLSYAPPLLNTLLGREVFPQATADTALIESVADALTEEDIHKLAGSLKPELWGPLAYRMHQYMQKKNKELEQQKAAAALVSPDPEAEAAGEVVRLFGSNG